MFLIDIWTRYVEHLLYVLDVDDALMNVVETCMIDGEWHTREWLCDVVKNSECV